MRVLKRTVVGAVAAGVAFIGLTATSAQAKVVPCAIDTTSRNWTPQCFTWPDDGDPGGVSGEVRLVPDDSGEVVRLSFDALGEHFSAVNQSDMTFFVEAEWWAEDGTRRRILFERVGPGEKASWNRSVAENCPVLISMMTGTGKGAVNNKLVA